MSKYCQAPGDHCRLILEVGSGQVQIGRLHTGMPSFMPQYRFYRVRISILTFEIMSGTWRLLKAGSGQVQVGRLCTGMPFYMP